MAKTTKQAASNVLGVDRRDAALVAANKLETLADALVAISFFQDAAKLFEDVETAAAIVSSVVQRQSKLAGIIVRALDGSTDSDIDLGLEADNG